MLQSTLAYSLNSTGTPTLVVEMGVGMRITKGICEQLVDGIFNLMKQLGIWQGEVKPVRKPMISIDGNDVSFLNAKHSGIFLQTAIHGQYMKSGEEIGRIVNRGGIVISCGWNSGGIGKKYGFEILEILLVPHGGAHNDTIVTVERKIK